MATESDLSVSTKDYASTAAHINYEKGITSITKLSASICDNTNATDTSASTSDKRSTTANYANAAVGEASSSDKTINHPATSTASSGSKSMPKRQTRRSSVKKPLQRGSWQGEQQRTIFSRSRSLSECHSSPRSISMECPDASGTRESQSNFCRVRSFKNTRKGLIRDGESFKSIDTKTFMSAGSVRVYRESVKSLGRSQSIDSTDSSVGGSSVAESYYRVGVLGAADVGKTTLVKQFLASEDQGKQNTSGENCKRPVTVSVLLDGEESLVEFLDHSEDDVIDLETVPSGRVCGCANRDEMSDDSYLDFFHCDAYAVVFALNDVDSFLHGGRSLRHLREELGSDRAIILVGNKSDLVRQRHICHKDACDLAHQFDCKYIETSAVLGHHTDELLVGLVRQICLKLKTISQEETKSMCDAGMNSKPKHHKWSRLLQLYRFLHGTSKSMDSCQNLFI